MIFSRRMNGNALAAACYHPAERKIRARWSTPESWELFAAWSPRSRAVQQCNIPGDHFDGSEGSWPCIRDEEEVGHGKTKMGNIPK